MSRGTIERLYEAFANLDGAGMEDCYADKARFEDPVYALAGRRQIGAMWRMLCADARRRGFDRWALEVHDIRASAASGSAYWEARYVFGRAARRVHNRVEARFDFDDEGLIVRHRDGFSFWRWARQALGPSGWLLGWSPWLHKRVQHQAGQQLRRYMEKNRR